MKLRVKLLLVLIAAVVGVAFGLAFGDGADATPDVGPEAEATALDEPYHYLTCAYIGLAEFGTGAWVDRSHDDIIWNKFWAHCRWETSLGFCMEGIYGYQSGTYVFLGTVYCSALFPLKAPTEAGHWAPRAPTDWADGDNTAAAWNICLWTGARDIGTHNIYLERARNIDWGGDAWVGCDFRIERPQGSFVVKSCQHAFVDRDTSWFAYWLTPTPWSAVNGCRH